MPDTPFSPIEQAFEDLRQGKLIILSDDEDRENEGDLVMAAEKVTPEAINFMLTHGRGVLCLPMTRQRCEQLNLHLQTPQNTARFGTRLHRHHRRPRSLRRDHRRLRLRSGDDHPGRLRCGHPAR